MVTNLDFLKSPELQEAILKSRRGNGNIPQERALIRGAAGAEKQKQITGKRVASQLETGKKGLELSKGRFGLQKTGAEEGRRRTELALKTASDQLAENIAAGKEATGTRRIVTGLAGGGVLADILSAQVEKERSAKIVDRIDKLKKTAIKQDDKDKLFNLQLLELTSNARA